MRKALVFMCLLLAGCSGSSPATPTVAPTPEPTATIANQIALAATATPRPLRLPTPTPAPTATPEPPSCMEQSTTFVTQANELLREWDDALKLAQGTPRIQLPDQIAKLQVMHRRAEDLPAPSCAVQIRAVMVNAMSNATESLIEFMGQTDLADTSGGIIESAQRDLDIVRYTFTAMADFKGSWQPFTVEDVKGMFPQYSWEDKTYKFGQTAIVAKPSSVTTIQVNHENGIVYNVYVGAAMFDNPDHSAAWQIIAPTASAFLPNWKDRDAWLAEFGAAEPTDTTLVKTEHNGVTTVVAQRSADNMFMELVWVNIYIPHK